MKKRGLTRDIVFRVWKAGHFSHGVIALWPATDAEGDGRFCDSYAHVGQHGAADYFHVIAHTRPATWDEYRDLLNELIGRGYTDCHVIQRSTVYHTNVRRRCWESNMTKKKSNIVYGTREEWLLALVDPLRSEFTGVGLTVPDIRISCSWPSRSIRKRIGECWHSKAAKDGRRHIFISPLIADSVAVAEIVVHELIHACLPDEAGHKKPFRDAMQKIGLEGKPTATHAGEKLRERLHALCENLGDYPHAPLELSDTKEKKQGTRMLKLECQGCGYVVRGTQKWIDIGLPTCCCGVRFRLA